MNSTQLSFSLIVSKLSSLSFFISYTTAFVNLQTEALTSAEKTYQNMCAGVTTEGDEESGTLTDQLSHANKMVSEAEEAGKQAEMTVKHLTATVKKLKTELKVTPIYTFLIFL